MGNTNGTKISPEGLPKQKMKVTMMWENFIKLFRKKKSVQSSLEEPAKQNHGEVENKEQEFAFPEICEYTQKDILHQLREEGIIGAKNATNKAGGFSFFVTTSDANVTQPRPMLLTKLDRKPSRTQSEPSNNFNMDDKMLVADILRQECIAKKIEMAQKCGKKRKTNLDKNERAQAARTNNLKEKLEMKMIVADANRHGEICKKKVAATKASSSMCKGQESKKDEEIDDTALNMIVVDANRLEEEAKSKAKARRAILRTAPSEKMDNIDNS